MSTPTSRTTRDLHRHDENGSLCRANLDQRRFEPFVPGVLCAYTQVMSAKAERLHLRVDAEQKALLEAASQAAGASVSTFVLKAATDAAADVLADRRVFLLDEGAWRVFDEALERPAQDVAGLRDLLAGPTALDSPAEIAQR
jgi:uncharacterized protein (DUF1778 family)